MKLGIDKLVCIGGDGSLFGANLLSTEWPEFVKELYEEKEIDEDTMNKHKKLMVVGMVGSIDNDFCGTDMTIGADTALHRIIDAVDCILTTASSHQRTFIIEVMGRNCGYLALMSSLAVGADYCFIPESPTNDCWKDKLCRAVKRGRDIGRRHSIIIVAEGAIDIEGNPISVDQVKTVLNDRLKYDARITILGHVQRGGAPSGYDRLISTSMGVESVNKLFRSDDKSESVVITIEGDRIVERNLMACVEGTQLIGKYIKERNFETVMKLRPPEFNRAWTTYLNMARTKLKVIDLDDSCDSVVLLNIGAPAPGMNAAVRALTRLTLANGYKVYASNEGVRGLVDGNMTSMDWISVDGWSNIGGSLLGTNRELPDEFIPQIAETLSKYKVRGMFIIGGWEGYVSGINFSKFSKEYKSLNIPIICIPATISNNCPGTKVSLGTDTALDMIVKASDTLKLSASASRCRVFIMEVHGGKCGYLAIAASIAGGGHVTYTPEEGITLKRLSDDVDALKKRFATSRTMALIVNSECSNATYTTDKISEILKEEGKGIFEVRKLVLGHIQQGNVPSPRDRTLAVEFSSKAIEVFLNSIKSGMIAQCGIGLTDQGVQSESFEELKENMNFKLRRPIKEGWDPLLTVIRSLQR